MKTIHFSIIAFVLIIQFSSISCRNKRDISVSVNSDGHSGVYEGIIDFSMCCESYEKGEGWIAFDFSGESPVVLYDGVFLDNISLQGNKLISSAEYSEYPQKIVGVFGESNGGKGLWYNYRDADPSGSAGKTFLKKVNEDNKERELIAKYKEERIRFNEFWAEFKSAVDSRDWNKIASFAYFPLTDESSIAINNKWNSTVNNENELTPRLKKIFAGDFLGEFGKFEAFRQEDSYPGYNGGVYFFNTMGADMVFMELNGEFKLTKIFGPAG